VSAKLVIDPQVTFQICLRFSLPLHCLDLLCSSSEGKGKVFSVVAAIGSIVYCSFPLLLADYGKDDLDPCRITSAFVELFFSQISIIRYFA